MKNPRTATKSSPCSPQPEKACAQQQRPSAIKNKSVNTRHYKATVVETACHNSTGVKIDTLDKLNMTEHLEINPHICDQLIFQCCQRDSIGKILYVNGTRITGYLHRKNNEPQAQLHTLHTHKIISLQRLINQTKQNKNQEKVKVKILKPVGEKRKNTQDFGVGKYILENIESTN